MKHHESISHCVFKYLFCAVKWTENEYYGKWIKLHNVRIIKHHTKLVRSIHHSFLSIFFLQKGSRQSDLNLENRIAIGKCGSTCCLYDRKKKLGNLSHDSFNFRFGTFVQNIQHRAFSRTTSSRNKEANYTHQRRNCARCIFP